MRSLSRVVVACAFLVAIAAPSSFAFSRYPFALDPQVAGNSGTISGIVTDSSKAAIPGAVVVLHNPVSGYTRTTRSDGSGHYLFPNLPFNLYHLDISSPGFAAANLHVTVNSSVPQTPATELAITSASAEVTVEAPGGDLLENSPTFHVDLDRSSFDKLPLESKTSSVSSLLTLASPGVTADSNGLFHGLGDHAENAFYVDGQPVTDQQSKVFSNQIPLAAIQSIEVISGAPPAEYGEKTSLVANITTRSGQGAGSPHGSITGNYGSFGTSAGAADLAVGSNRFGNFTAIDFLNTGRFLDPAEFSVFHAKGNEADLFDRVDLQVSPHDALHTNFELTRSWFQTPNSYDNLNLVSPVTGVGIGNADQRSKIVTVDVAPSLTHTLSPNSVATFGLWMRRDAYHYYPSNNPLADLGPIQQESVSQDRSLLNSGARLEGNYSRGVHTVKFGSSYQQTLLNENFGLGIVDPLRNSPCVDATGASVPGFTSPNDCAAAGYFPNTTANPVATNYFNPLLGCLDLTRPNPAAADACAQANATPYRFLGHTDVKLLTLYGQDTIALGRFTINAGLRGDFYNGLSTERQAEPRLGVSYSVPRSATVLRLSYARSLETPFNENLVLSSRGCNSDVLSALVPCVPADFNPGYRNEFHAGFEQSISRHLVISGDYLWKYTHNGYDFSVLAATPITFPIAWHNSKISGFAIRATVPEYRGVTAFVVLSSVSARFFPPQIGGLGATNTSGAPFRIDHDERFNQTTNLQYAPRFAGLKRYGSFVSLNWRYDSGLVAGAVPYAVDSTTPVDLTGLTADQQAQAGLACGSQKATLAQALTTCAPSQYHSDLIALPAPGTQNDDHNPARIAPRNLFDLSLGADDLVHLGNEKRMLSARLTVVNLTDKVALYNFLSTFSGTHYVTPRAITGEVGFHF